MMESGKKKDENTLWQSQRPFVGALIGVLIFLAILLPLKLFDYNSSLLYRLALNLELLGRLTVLMLGMSAKVDLPVGVANLVSITISAIPAWITGWQIGSQSTKMQGIVFFVGYLVFIYAFGALLAFAGI